MSDLGRRFFYCSNSATEQLSYYSDCKNVCVTWKDTKIVKQEYFNVTFNVCSDCSCTFKIKLISFVLDDLGSEVTLADHKILLLDHGKKPTKLTPESLGSEYSNRVCALNPQSKKLLTGMKIIICMGA